MTTEKWPHSSRQSRGVPQTESLRVERDPRRCAWPAKSDYLRLIRNSSRFAPALSFSTSHFGVSPRPDQVAPD